MLNLETNIPKISCLLVTAGGRFEYFKQSVRCYLDQTYPNTELLILNEGPKEYQQQISEHVEKLNRPDIRPVFLNGDYTLGALRNISIGLAEGDLFCQWDDDDFNMPNRLAVQFSYLRHRPHLRAVYLSDQLHYYFPTRELYWEDWKMYLSSGLLRYSLIPGTILAWKKGLEGRYPSSGTQCKTGEDTVFSNYLLSKHVNIEVLSGFGNLQIYSFHGKNVFDLEHHTVLSRLRSHGRQKMIQERERICKTIDYLKLEGKINVMGREGLAFTYTCGDS